MPRHLLISEKLRAQILDGTYAQGEQLPSEFDLGVQFGVSRTTVRRAIANLVNQGLVSAHRGKGVFVTEQKKVAFSLSNPLTFFEADLARQGVVGNTRNLSFEVLKPPRNICQRLELPSSESKAYCQRQVIFTNQIPTALDIAYYPIEIGSVLSEGLPCAFTYTTLEHSGFPLVRADVVIECTHATHAISEHLAIPMGAPILVHHYTAYISSGQPVVCGETFSRTDRSCYSVVLSKEALASSTQTDSEP